MSEQVTDPLTGDQTTMCPCGAITVTFNPEAARNLNSEAVRKRWPRGRCSRCHTIVYASSLHYIMGDW